MRDCFGRRMKWLEEAIKREAGEEFGSLGVFTREREVFEILKGST